MEVTCSDQPGLLAMIAMILADHQVSILDARINTYGERVQDQFSILLPEQDPSLDDHLLEQLATSLTGTLDPQEAAPKPTPMSNNQ